MEFNTFALARILHVIGVVLWIGGVAMVTTVLLPATRRLKSAEEQVAFFEKIEQGFAQQARYTTLLTGLSGFYLVTALDAWPRYGLAQFWWMHAMTAVWAIFTLVLFVLEPLILHKWFLQKAAQNPEKTFRLIQRLHWVLLGISLITIFGAVGGAHGWMLPL